MGARVADSAARSTEQTQKETWARIEIHFLEWVSAICPAGRANRKIGNAWISPTQPRVIGLPVRWYSSHPTTTLCTESPRAERFLPKQNSWYSRSRKAAYGS